MMDTNLSLPTVLEEYGKLFYIIHPGRNSFPGLEGVPDYVQQAMPYMVTLIVLEAVVNLWLGKRHNIADSVTSISCGLLMTALGLLTKGSMLALYVYIHEHHRVLDLPWDSTLTWILSAMAVDCGYYWFHRASHEVGLLWAVHQVHHSSQEFNLTTAFRQPLLQGLFQLTHWFYLPAALIIPPSQFLVHSQFVFLFQFWIHSELVGDLGPLGLLLNTSTYHQVHHGANRYCLDKNYGGFLSIWDRIFGTFQDLRTDQEIVYGLIDQPKFFDVIYHQLFYFPSLQNKVADSNNWWDSLAVWIKGPGWFPGLPRLGNNDLCPEVPQREKHYADIPLLTHLFLILQLFGVFIIHDDLTKMFSTVSQPVSLGVMAFLFWTLTNIGLYYDNNSKALPSEIGRCVTALALYQPVLSLSPSVFTVWTVTSLGTALALNFYTPEKRKAE